MSMALVVSTALSKEHTFTKEQASSIMLVTGLGILSDCHYGATVQHRSRLHIQPPPSNLRQVHLLGVEILEANDLQPAEIGENITTRGIDLLSLGRGTRLHFMQEDNIASDSDSLTATTDPHAIVVVTGLRNPCPQIEKHRVGLQAKFLTRDEDRKIVARKAGVMGIVEVGGVVKPGMIIVVEEPKVHIALEPV